MPMWYVFAAVFPYVGFDTVAFWFVRVQRSGYAAKLTEFPEFIQQCNGIANLAIYLLLSMLSQHQSNNSW